jgi:hypothetical protein
VKRIMLLMAIAVPMIRIPKLMLMVSVSKKALRKRILRSRLRRRNLTKVVVICLVVVVCLVEVVVMCLVVVVVEVVVQVQVQVQAQVQAQVRLLNHLSNHTVEMEYFRSTTQNLLMMEMMMQEMELPPYRMQSPLLRQALMMIGIHGARSMAASFVFALPSSEIVSLHKQLSIVIL